MHRLQVISTLVYIFFSLAGCAPGPKPIAYGTDACHFCRMTIVDRQHAAELVTQKGKVFKFDAVECMVNSIEEIGVGNISQYLCNTNDVPGELVDATAASFLVSEALPSPMGANLTAFSTQGEANKAHEEYGGRLYTWEPLLSYLKSLDYVYHQ